MGVLASYFVVLAALNVIFITLRVLIASEHSLEYVDCVLLRSKINILWMLIKSFV